MSGLAAYTTVYVGLATAGLMLLRRSLGGGERVATLARDPELLLGVAFYAASFLTFVLALRRFELLTVYPVFSGVAYVSITVAAALFLHEPLGIARLLGVALVGTGVILLVR